MLVVDPVECQQRWSVGLDALAVRHDRTDGTVGRLDVGDSICHTGDGCDRRHRVGGQWWGVAEVRMAADLQIDTGCDVFGHFGEAAAQSVAEHECRDDEADRQDHAEGGEGETYLVRQKVLDGQSKHGRAPIVSSSSGGGQLLSRRMWSSTASGVGSINWSVMRPSARKITRSA